MDQTIFSQKTWNDYPLVWPLATSQPRMGPARSDTSRSNFTL